MNADSVVCKSRIGSKPIQIPAGVSFEYASGIVHVTGPKGEFKMNCSGSVRFEREESVLRVLPTSNDSKSIWGTIRSIVANAVSDVVNPHVVELQITGVGYKAEEVKGDQVVKLNLPEPGTLEQVIKKAAENVKNKKEIDQELKSIIGGSKFVLNEIRGSDKVNTGVRFALNKSHRDLVYNFVSEEEPRNNAAYYIERSKDGKLIRTRVAWYLPKGITLEVSKDGTGVKVIGIDRAVVGDVAAKIIRLRPVNPYNGAGITLKGSIIRRKEGKKKK